MGNPVTAVVYHNFGRETDFERGLGVTTSVDMFRRQNAYFNRRYSIVDLDALLSGRLPKRPLLITFDDYYRSALEAIDEVLRPLGIPSVYFINPALLGGKRIAMDNLLAACVNRFGIAQLCAAAGLQRSDSLASLITNQISNLSRKQCDSLKSALVAKFPLEDFHERSAILQPDDLPRLAKMNVEIGNHTGSHVFCRNLSHDEMRDELVDAKKSLEAMSGTEVRAFSAPYGYLDDLKPEVLATLRSSGHKALFVVHGRSNRSRPAPDIWYRHNVLNNSPARCFLSLRVVPVLKSLKHLAIRNSGAL